jgi:glycine cleavage system protein P-like pyridoxal-binding family
VACLMMTNPNTVGIFEKDIQTIAHWLHAAPVNTPVGRLDEVGAARNPVLRWKPA